ncbi:MAG: class I SAM-dependent methyltransferase [Actinobacteria bacterium]|nr:class I SAM-dependent methyltransferase [Actinomycetota bacterium]
MEILESWGLLASLVLRRPREFYDRMAGYADLGLDLLSGASPTYETVIWKNLLRDLEERFGHAAGILNEPALAEVEEHTRQLLKDIHGEDPFSPRWAVDSLLARCCYLMCRLLEPAAVVETGVAYGVSAAFILRALEENGRGVLHSVDLPPLRREYERFWGMAVDGSLSDRWVLHRGASTRVLPRLLEETGTVDLFVHDSLHTYRNMRREFELAWPRLRAGGALVADDIERNRAFGELRQKTPALWRVVRDQEERPLHGRAAPVVFGIAVK